MKQIMLAGRLPVSSIAMGCMRLDGAKETPDRVIGTALDLGINFFDHADIYGGGRCEEIFGDYLRQNPLLREKIIIQTKCGIRRGFFEFSKEHILRSVDVSL